MTGDHPDGHNGWKGRAAAGLETLLVPGEHVPVASWVGWRNHANRSTLFHQMKEGATAETLFKTNKNNNKNLIKLLSGQYPILSNCTAAKLQL